MCSNAELYTDAARRSVLSPGPTCPAPPNHRILKEKDKGELPAAGPDDGGRRPKRLQRFDAPGERGRYFADDDAPDLAQLVKRQRYEGAEDIDANLAENISRKARYKCAALPSFGPWPNPRSH
jgi:hypothetical protein